MPYYAAIIAGPKGFTYKIRCNGKTVTWGTCSTWAKAEERKQIALYWFQKERKYA